MSGIAPVEIQHIDRTNAEFYKKAAESVEQATGKPTSPASLKPEDETPVGKIREEIGNMARFTGSSIEEAVSGKTSNTNVMSVKGNQAVKIINERRLRRGFFERLGLKKAA